jgi:hypothetical protein
MRSGLAPSVPGSATRARAQQARTALAFVRGVTMARGGSISARHRGGPGGAAHSDRSVRASRSATAITEYAQGPQQRSSRGSVQIWLNGTPTRAIHRRARRVHPNGNDMYWPSTSKAGSSLTWFGPGRGRGRGHRHSWSAGHSWEVAATDAPSKRHRGGHREPWTSRSLTQT